MKNASFWITKLNLQKHPEGGWFNEVYRSEEVVLRAGLPERYSSERNFSTSIYYLLEGNHKSNFHRIRSDEIWHFYQGTSSVEVLVIVEGKIERLKLGSAIEKGDSFQLIIPKNTWFAAHLPNKKGYALLGCTVAPGFDFNDFELADRISLKNEFPHLVSVIEDFTV